MGSVSCAQAMSQEQEFKNSSYSQMTTQLDTKAEGSDETKNQLQINQLKSLENLENVISWLKKLGKQLEIESEIQEVLNNQQAQVQEMSTLEAQINLRVQIVQNIFSLIECYQNRLMEKSRENLSLLSTSDGSFKEAQLFQLENLKIQYIQTQQKKIEELEQNFEKEKSKKSKLKKDLKSFDNVQDLKDQIAKLELQRDDQNEQIGALSTKSANLEKQVQQYEKQIQEEKLKVDQISKELQKFQNQLNENTKTMSSKQKQNDESQIRISQLDTEKKSLQKEIQSFNENMIKERAEKESQIKQLSSEIQQLQEKIKQFNEKNITLQKKLSQIEIEKLNYFNEVQTLKTSIQNQKQENENISNQLKELKQEKQSLLLSNEVQAKEKGNKISELETQNQNNQAKLKKAEEAIISLQEDIKNLQENKKSQEIEIQSWRSQALQYAQKKEEIDEIYQSKVKDMQLINVQQEEIQNLQLELKYLKEGKKFEPQIEIEIGIVNQITESYENEIKSQKKQAIEQNILVKDILSHYVTEKMLAEEEIWRHFENFLLEKYQQDNINLNSGNKSDLFVNFVYQSAFKLSEDHTQAKQFLSSLLITLQDMNQKNIEYGSIFCRFLQIYHEDPFDRNLSSFLIACNFRFFQAVEQYRLGRMLHETAIHQEILKEEIQEEASEGGYAPLIDVFEITLKIFEENKELCGNILFKLIPEHKNQQDFVLFFIC